VPTIAAGRSRRQFVPRPREHRDRYPRLHSALAGHNVVQTDSSPSYSTLRATLTMRSAGWTRSRIRLARNGYPSARGRNEVLLSAGWACDFFVAVTAMFRAFSVFLVLDVGTRRIPHSNVTAHIQRLEAGGRCDAGLSSRHSAHVCDARVGFRARIGWDAAECQGRIC
jgi:hypothetical protein